MRLETVDAFVQQLILHKLQCKKWRFLEHSPHEYAGRYGFTCEICRVHWEIDPVLLMNTPWRYIRGAEKEQFQDFVHDMDSPSSTYEDLFVAHLIMTC